MPVTVSYPGLYIEELPSNARSILAAPTSIAVFIGYTHPFRTKPGNFGNAVRCFSFSDYEREFGGLYLSGTLDANVAHAVNQFFQNGGSDAYVIGLLAQYQRSVGGPLAISQPAGQLLTSGANGIAFSGLEPTDHPSMQLIVSLTNVKASILGGNLDTADFIVTYGTRVETFRSVKLTAADLEGKINTTSSLIQVAPVAGSYGTQFASATIAPISLTQGPIANLTGTFAAADYVDVFDADKALDKIPIFNLLMAPGVTDNAVMSAALAFAERKQAFVIIDPPANAGADATNPPAMADVFNGGTIPRSQNGAIYFPYVRSINPVNGNTIELPPSGFVAGIFARTDTNRGVWKAPAGLEAIVKGTTGVVDSGKMTDMTQGVLNLAGVNCLRDFSGIGTVVFGARTLVSSNVAFQQNKYVPVRRMTLFLEQTLLQNLKWIVFEPNDEPLWLAIRTTIENFMLSLHRQGALQGKNPSDAFQVKCDATTTTQDDINNGIVNIIVAFAPLKPAEFVIIKIAHLAGQTQQ